MLIEEGNGPKQHSLSAAAGSPNEENFPRRDLEADVDQNGVVSDNPLEPPYFQHSAIRGH